MMWGRWRLVDGRELYNIQDDPGQQQDVAAANPELVKRLRGQYGAWWDGVSSTLTSYQPLTIGSDAENPARLCSCDWAWVYADNQRGIRGPVMDSGTWHVDAARAGLYSFTLRRWPEESGSGHLRPGAGYAGRGRQLAGGQGAAGCLGLAAGGRQRADAAGAAGRDGADL